MQQSRHFISIWFFIGVLLTFYGVLILYSGIFLRAQRHVVMAELHADIWWGALLVIVGGVYAYRFRPRSGK